MQDALIPQIKEMPIKFVPHRRYIMATMFAGLPDDEINALCTVRNYNLLPDYIMDDIRAQCLEMKNGKKMMSINQDKYKYGERRPYIDDVVASQMRQKKMFVDLVNITFGNTRERHQSPETTRILKIVERRKERTYLEIAAVQGQPVELIATYFTRLIPENYNKVTLSRIIAHYYSYFWEANISNMKRNQCDIYDIARYIHLDEMNKFYIPHRNFMFATHQVLCAYLGLSDEIDRRTLNAELWGKMLMQVEEALESNNKFLPKWISDLFSKINDGLIAEEEIKGMQYYRDKITQITARAIALSNTRITREELRKKKRDREELEQDETFDPRKKDETE